MSNWQPIETAPRDGRPFIALNYDRGVWVAKYDEDGRLLFRTNARNEPQRHVLTQLADGTQGWVRDESFGEDEWQSCWTIWTRLYDFKPTHWMPLPEPPEVTP